MPVSVTCMNREQLPADRSIKGRRMMIRSEAAPAAFNPKAGGPSILRAPFYSLFIQPFYTTCGKAAPPAPAGNIPIIKPSYTPGCPGRIRPAGFCIFLHSRSHSRR